MTVRGRQSVTACDSTKVAIDAVSASSRRVIPCVESPGEDSPAGVSLAMATIPGQSAPRANMTCYTYPR